MVAAPWRFLSLSVSSSAVFEMGNTKVIAAVYGPREVQNRSQQINDQALAINRDISGYLPDMQAINRDISGYSPDHGSMHIDAPHASFSGSTATYRGPFLLEWELLGTRSACINAATFLALADAGIPMCDLVTSCSAGYLNSTPLLDLNYVEDSAGGPDVTVGILPKLDKVTLLQMDAKLPMDVFENVMQLAIEGCKAVANYIWEVLLENTKRLECRRGV